MQISICKKSITKYPNFSNYSNGDFITYLLFVTVPKSVSVKASEGIYHI